jgi:hypothetical protein
MQRLIRHAVWRALLFAMVLAPPLLAEEVVRSGVDMWMTAEGFSHSSFASDPIPADFFCPGSKPFAGTIELKGVPLATEPARTLGSIDTIVRRLDDAAFSNRGEARTRIQLLALSLASVKPFDTGCGLYDMAIRLDGDQPATQMSILRNEKHGGTYVAPLAIKAKLVFTPVDGKGSRRELARRVDLGPGTNSVWTYAALPAYEGRVRVDTDGDGAPDTLLPPASNFLAGVSPIARASTGATPGTAPGTVTPGTPQLVCPVGQCKYQSCHCTGWDDNPTWDEPAGHCEDAHLHCVWVCVRCELIGNT